MTMKEKRTIVLVIDTKGLGDYWDVCWMDLNTVFRPRRYKSCEIKIGKRHVKCYYEMNSRPEARDHAERINNSRDKHIKAKLLCP